MQYIFCKQTKHKNGGRLFEFVLKCAKVFIPVRLQTVLFLIAIFFGREREKKKKGGGGGGV